MLLKTVRDVLPRHTKSYLWITFLVAVFMVMALSENGITIQDSSLPVFSSPINPLTPSTITKADASISHTNSSFTSPGTPPTTKNEELLFNGLSPNDIVIVVKTGATSLWRRLPIHMSTTLSNPLLTPHILIYSDGPSSINGHPIFDSLSNVSSSLKSSPDFALYNRAREIEADNLYLESGSMEGDSYLSGGWRLDKYKFVPMFQHVANVMPGKKWYIYLEDDNFYFWPTLYSFLGTMDHTSPLLIGSPAFRLGEDFAHGGSGFAISGKALSISFGADPLLASKYEDYSREQCCGDQVLSHVLKSKGVERYKELDGTGWAAMQSLPFWRIGFGDWNWCSPIMNIHKVHQRDVSLLFEFSNAFRTRTNGTEHIRYRDIYTDIAKQGIQKEAQKSEWDNYAAAKTYASSGDVDVNQGVKISESEMKKKPWYSVEACKEACKAWESCLSWKYADDNCALDHTAAMGQRIDAGIRMESGWMLERIAKLEGKKCEALNF